MIAAGNTKPKILINLTAMILAVIRHVIKRATTTRKELECLA
jgi:hypothetical protein